DFFRGHAVHHPGGDRAPPRPRTGRRHPGQRPLSRRYPSDGRQDGAAILSSRPPVGYLSNTGHWPDTGGMVPGGFSATATEIVQEGLRLPPGKLVRRGEICQGIIDIVLNNLRAPDERIGGIRAQPGALSGGEKRLTQLLDRYGVETV